MKKTKWLALALLFSLAVTGSYSAQAAEETELIMLAGSSKAILNSKEINISDEKLQLTPDIYDDRAYVPKEFAEKNLKISISKKVKSITTEEGMEYVSVRDIADNYNFKVFYNNGVIVLTNKSDAKAPAGTSISSYKKQLSVLPKVGTSAKLVSLLGKNEGYMDGSAIWRLSGGIAREESGTLNSAPQKQMAAEAKSDHSTTNVQVEGVDEGDIIKTDGIYIYFASQNKINIVKAQPSDKMEVMAKLSYADEDYINEIFINDNQLIVITSSYEMPKILVSEAANDIVSKKMLILDRQIGKQNVKVYVYNLSNIKTPKLVKSTAMEGNFLTARKTGDNLYFIVQNYLYYNKDSDNYPLPVLRDAISGKESAVSYGAISYFPEAISSQMTNIIGVNLKNINAEPFMESYLGGGENIYMSTENIYIATTSYAFNSNNSAPYYHTNVYKFSLRENAIQYENKGRVEGNILNQFSMDENNGYFRIATTSRLGNGGSTNSLFVLNKSMDTYGKVKNIAPGEQIYSVRFMGDKAYMVTFEVTDPLFVIDLKDPAKPAILGQLKIPGYSNYLHPYDANHLIGFGIDTSEKDGRAYNKGMKISLFDVSDLHNPKEKFVTVIGDRGTSSELLNNHKALLFDKEKNIMAFPVEVRTINSGSKDDLFSYGDFKFQGAYVYSIDMEKGFNLKETITHQKDSSEIYDYDTYVQRIIYIGDYLYTVSNGEIMATSLKDMKVSGTVELK